MNMFTDDSNFMYILKMMGQKVKINDKEEQVLISNYKDKKIDYKKIKGTISFNTGDIVEYQGSNWIITSEVSKTNTIYKATMQKAEQSFKMFIDDILEEIPTIIQVGTQGLDENRYVTTLDGTIKLTIQDNLITKKITYSNRIIIMETAWKITAITTENKGLRYIYFEKDEFDPTKDNLELEIADFYKHQHTYKISVINIPTDILTVKLASIPIQLEVQITDEDNKILPNPTLIFTSSNSNIISISNTGLITPITLGNCTLSVKFNDTIKIINIVVESLPIVDNLSISIIGESTTYMNMNETYIAKVMNNGIEITGKNVDWSISDLTFATIASKSGMNCNLKTNMKNKFGVFKLKCWQIDDLTVFVEKEIRVSRM